MGATDPGSAREEAERLVATALAAARLAAAGARNGQWGPLGGIVSSVLSHSDSPGAAPGAAPGGFATGTAECCVCPVCRGIAALRDPSPEFAERLATGAGDLAAGVASLLRAFAPPEPSAEADARAAQTPAAEADARAAQTPAAEADAPPAQTPPADADAPPAQTPARDTAGEHVWREATRSRHDSQPAPERDVWSAATRAEDTTLAPVAPPVDAAGPAAAVTVRTSTDGPAVPASRAPGDAGEQPAGDGA